MRAQVLAKDSGPIGFVAPPVDRLLYVYTAIPSSCPQIDDYKRQSLMPFTGKKSACKQRL